jgi:murein L,D-transpeptidase YafK
MKMSRDRKSRLFFVCATAFLLVGVASLSAAEAKVDRVLVEKAKRKLTLFAGGKPLKVYSIALGTNPLGAKEEEGDGKTPEGIYKIDWRNPKSEYHLSLHVSYPNEADKARARKSGVSPGGDIMIHGLPSGMSALGASHRLADWTIGCVAVTNEEIEEIWKLVSDGTPIEFKP